MMPVKMKLVSGNSNIILAKEISQKLGIPLLDSIVSKFSDGEIRIQINESVRGDHVFVIQSTNPPADNLMELLLIIDALKRASAGKITAVIPYYGYARQDKKDNPRVPISGKLVADLLMAAGTTRLMTLELHAEQIQGFFNYPVDHLYSAPIFIDYIKKHFDIANSVIVSPDAGRVNKARSFANKLGGLPIAIIDKRRSKPNEASIMNVVGNVKGKNVLMVDDIIDTAGTITKASYALKESGAEEISAIITHSILSGNAVEKMKKSSIDRLITTNSVNIADEKKIEKIEFLSCAQLFANVIERVHSKKSISVLFD
ncbi:MAG: ribose-phosphate pyrophosphokinase [bacterium]